jgi:colicin import membrane protein
MDKKPNGKGVSPELAQAEERIEAIKSAIAQAMIQRNTLPKSASDEEKAAVAVRVEQLQVRHHEAVQHVLAIRRQETTKLEREHKEKKLRHKQLRASRQPGGHAVAHEESAAPPRRSSVRLPMDRAVEEARMDAANEEDLFLLRQELEEEDDDSADELAHQRDLAEKKRKKEQADKRREAEKREMKEAELKAEAARLKAEKEADAKIRQKAALQRAGETKAKKRKQRAEREARQRAAQNAQTSGWFSEVLRQLKSFFGGRR